MTEYKDEVGFEQIAKDLEIADLGLAIHVVLDRSMTASDMPSRRS